MNYMETGLALEAQLNVVGSIDNYSALLGGIDGIATEGEKFDAVMGTIGRAIDTFLAAIADFLRKCQKITNIKVPPVVKEYLNDGSIINKIIATNEKAFNAVINRDQQAGAYYNDHINDIMTSFIEDIKEQKADKDKYIEIPAAELKSVLKEMKECMEHVKKAVKQMDAESFPIITESYRRSIAIHTKLFNIIVNVYAHAPNVKKEKNGEFVPVAAAK